MSKASQRIRQLQGRRLLVAMSGFYREGGIVKTRKVSSIYSKFTNIIFLVVVFSVRKNPAHIVQAIK